MFRKKEKGVGSVGMWYVAFHMQHRFVVNGVGRWVWGLQGVGGGGIVPISIRILSNVSVFALCLYL